MRHISAYGVGALALVLAAACSSAPRQQTAPQRQQAAPDVWITPSNGTNGVRPDLPILVGTAHGRLKRVTVQAAGKPVVGRLSADRTRWRSVRPMAPGRTYTVTAVVTGPSGETSGTSTFTTVSAAQTFTITELLPKKEVTGETVGVGMPIMITFDRPIADRVSVERNLRVLSSKPVEGAWHWFDDKTVHYRPKRFWPANTKVRVEALLEGTAGGGDVYGDRDLVREFRVGRSQISTADIRTHQMRVERDGRVIRSIPISAGKGGVRKYHTTNGIHLAMSREDVTVMTSPDAGPGDPGYYQLTVYDTVRISNSGEYIHAAPWSVGSQGHANVSHGCVNVSPAHAKWFLDHTLIGDPIIVTGSPRELEPTNGWGQWQESWPQWLRWSALRTGGITESLSGPKHTEVAAQARTGS
ncbi:Ig-like domain-containing protein [Thermopolyspora sp. NPDC052614]|uniref:L,D-transpeptidase n=1 Tax=Thermopolyspora sp. NPDC052614 TaxID=3155682 RepID=UPI003421F24C